MPTFEITSPDGRKFQVTAPDGASQDDVMKYAQANMPAVQQAGSALNDVPRQLGLTARYGLEGIGGAMEVLSEPIRYVTDRMTDNVGKTKPAGALMADLADKFGLPKPRNATERVVGDASRMMASAGTMGGAAKKGAELTSGATSKALEFLAANPTQQLTSSAGAGLAGGASKEAGGNELQQGTSALLGGVAGGFAGSAAQSGANLAKNLVNKGLSPQQMDVKIGNILRQSGVDYNDIPEKVRQSLRAEMSSALNAGAELDPAAVSRLAAFREAGLTPTRGMVSQNPVQITREMNLAKSGANSADSGLYGLPLLQNKNNAQLIQNLNTLGAGRGDVLRAGETLAGAIQRNQAGLRSAEQSAWDAAKGTPGYTQPISANAINDINKTLGDEGLMPFMNPMISRYMEAFQSGQPFTPQSYRNLQSMLAREVSKGGNEGAAAGLARRVLEQSDLRPAGFVNSGTPLPMRQAAGMAAADQAASDSIEAVNAARRATRQAYAYEDSSPLVRSALSGGASADPQRIAQRFIIGGTANEARDIVRQIQPNELPQIKDAVLNHLKEKALSGASDETGKFSQAAFNNALNKLGEQKLSILFTPEEIKALKTNARVASLAMSQPVGSAVNNSNTGAMIMGRGYDALRSLAGKIPGGQQFIVDPLRNIEISVNTRRAQNVLPGLLMERETLPAYQSLLIPGLAAGGLLSSQ